MLHRFDQRFCSFALHVASLLEREVQMGRHGKVLLLQSPEKFLTSLLGPHDSVWFVVACFSKTLLTSMLAGTCRKHYDVL